MAALAARLDEGGRGDRGWSLLTRVHLSAVRLQQVAAYLNDAASSGAVLTLTPGHYANLAIMLGIAAPNPAITINRHYLLAMDNPLRLVTREDGVHWSQVLLTESGIALAKEPNTAGVLEDQLREVRFCRAPWYSQQRVDEYPEFDVQPYGAVIAVMTACAGYIDVDEFDLFVSRIREDAEIEESIKQVLAFRALTTVQQKILRELVANRIPAGGGNNPQKLYNNWRDMARHTFSLFSLGERAIQVDNRLHLSAAFAMPVAAPELQEGGDEGAANAVPDFQVPATLAVLIPEAGAPPGLLTPPAAPQVNNGAEAEILIGKIFAAAGWSVAYYTQKRGYGFDIWVRKGGQAFVVEIKSFVGEGTSVTLTALELQAAQHHGDNYLLAVVENATSQNPSLHVIQNPAGVLAFNQIEIAQYSVGRAQWIVAATELEP